MSFNCDFKHGFMHGMFDQMMFGGGFCGLPTFSPLRWGSCWSTSCCATPMFFMPNIFSGNFTRYITPEAGVPSFTTVSMPTFSTPTFSSTQQQPRLDFYDFDFEYKMPDLSTVKVDNSYNNTFRTKASIPTDILNPAKPSSQKPSKAVSGDQNGRVYNSSNTLVIASKYDDLIYKYAKINGLEPEFVRAVIMQESSFNASAGSDAGARGLMQLMSGTASDLGVQDRLDPEENIKGGTKYLKQMMDKFNNNKELALAAYNAGPNNAAVKAGRIPQNDETPEYVEKVMGYYQQYKDLA